MTPRRRLAAGAAVAGALVTAPAALADANPNPLNGATPVGPTTSVPLPDGIAQCLIQNGFPTPLPSTKVALPATAAALPAAFTDTIPLPGVGVPSPGANPLPADGSANSTGGVQCGQVIV